MEKEDATAQATLRAGTSTAFAETQRHIDGFSTKQSS